MIYGIIFSMDCCRSESVEYYLPPRRIRRKLQCTEGDDQYDYGYLGGEWEKGKHRKLVGELNQKDFDEMVKHCGLKADDVETMGSLGVPWSPSGFGVAPAISFSRSDYSGSVSAYVTPIPEVELENRSEDEEWLGRCWERVRSVVIRRYS